MAKRELPSPELLRKLLRYEAETGKLFWRHRPSEMFPSLRAANSWNARLAGKEAFRANDGRGYLLGIILYVMYKAHRVIWAMEKGEWPLADIDHINGDRADNRIENLRAVSRAENCRNQRRREDNSSGVTGVYWEKRDEIWCARIGIHGNIVNLGSFSDFDEACAARAAAEVKYGFHANHGRSE